MEVTGTLCVSNEPKKYIYIREREKGTSEKERHVACPVLEKKKKGGLFEIRNPLFFLFLSFFIRALLFEPEFVHTDRQDV